MARYWNLLLMLRDWEAGLLLPAGWMGLVTVFCCLAVGVTGLELQGLPLVFLFSLWSGVRGGLPGA